MTTTTTTTFQKIRTKVIDGLKRDEGCEKKMILDQPPEKN